MISTTPAACEATVHHQSPQCKMPSWPCDIDSTKSTVNDRFRAAGHRPPSPCQMPSWPCDIDGTFPPNSQNRHFITLAHLALDRQEYLDSLVPPSSEDLIRIAGLQAIKEAQHKRRDRIHRRAVSEASLQRYQPRPLRDSTAPGQNDGYGSSRPPSSCHSDLPSSHRPGPAPMISQHSRSKSAAAIQRKVHHYPNSHGGGLPSQPKPINASTRWTQAIREARFRLLTAPRSRTGLAPEIIHALPPGFVLDSGNNETTSSLLALLSPKPPTARQRWKKAIAVACRAGFDPYAAAASDMASLSDDIDDYYEYDYSSEMEYISSASSIHLGTDSAYYSDHDSEHHHHHTKPKDHWDTSNQARAKAQQRKQKEEEAKMINDLYLLELVDVKHRYGINLFLYHEEWKKSSNNENFFFWLDFGQGRFLDLAAEGCPREKLEREQIRYLSFEERDLYRVVVGSGCLLCWAKNGVPVDTDSGRWRDSIAGIVPLGDGALEWRPLSNCQDYRGEHVVEAAADGSWLASSACSSGQDSRVGSSWSHDSAFATSLSSSEGIHHHGEGHDLDGDEAKLDNPTTTTTETETKHHPKSRQDSKHRNPHIKNRSKSETRSNSNSHSKSISMNKLKYGSSPATRLLDKFLRQQWGPKPWIFVADSAGRLYIGIKDSGSFQHTSFVRGSRVSAAGMISVKEGKVTRLSPLSGHYRPPTRNFRQFVRGLKEQGVMIGDHHNNSGSYPCSYGIQGTTCGTGKEKDRDVRKRWRFGEEMRLCYGHDYWLLRGFEIYSGVRKVFGRDEHDACREVSRKPGKGGCSR